MTHRIESFGSLLLAALLCAGPAAAPSAQASPAATVSSTAPASMAAPASAGGSVSQAAGEAVSGPAVKLELGTCADCHDAQAAALPRSIHGRAGVTCVGCHGGDATSDDQEQAMSPARGFLGKVGRRDVPPFCARCHSDEKRMAGTGLPTDQFSQYRASFHGKKVLGEGDTAAAVCTDCHGSHDVLPVKDPRSPANRVNIPATCDKCHGDDVKMNVYAIPTDQYKKWRTSFHGRAVLEKKDLTAAVCTDCHGKHDIVNPQDSRSRVHPVNIVTTCGRCHGNAELMGKHGLPNSIPKEYAEGVHGVALLKHGMTAAPNCTSCHGNHGALPPAVKNVAMVCGRCHTRSEEYYLKSPHSSVKAFKGCIECHGNHRIAKPGPYLFAVACL